MNNHCNIQFDKHTTIEALAIKLRCTPEVFYHSESDLRRHLIPKKNKQRGYRVVWEVKSDPLKQTLKTFEIEYFNFICSKKKGSPLEGFPLDCTHGFFKKRSILTNSQVHCGNSLLVKADIKDFFITIDRNRLKLHFADMNLDKTIIETLSSMLTINDKLPQGFCTSPLMSNIIFFEIDKMLLDLARKYDCVYTRYADDITFSSNNYIPKKTEIHEILHKGGFELANDKFKIKKRGQSFFVTGLSVDGNRPRVGKKWKAKLRQEMYFIKKYGLKEHSGKKNYSSMQICVNILDGKINFLNSIEPLLAKQLKQKWHALLKNQNMEVSYKSRGKYKSRNISIYVDESVKGDTIFLCFVVLEHDNEIEKSIKKLHTELSNDEFLPRNPGIFDKNHLHWNSLSVMARRTLVTTISQLPFSTYVAFSKYNKKYNKEYLSLFSKLLIKRYTKFDGSNMTIYVEQNPSIKNKDLQDLSDKLYKNLKMKSARRPLNPPSIKNAQKQHHPLLILPDSLLGVFGDIYDDNKETSSLTIKDSNFAILEYKYNCIQKFSETKNVETFTLNKPFDKTY